MRTKIFAIFFLFLGLFSFFGDKLLAWGPMTHMTILNDIMKDPNLDPTVKKNLQDNLKYAKGGVVGPDMFYFNDKRYSDIAHYCKPGDLAKRMLEMAKKDGDPKKIAFAYGWMIHVVSDSIGHPWVNNLAGGDYDPKNATIKKNHSHIEQSIDKRNYIEHAKKLTDPITGEDFAYYYDMDIDSPDTFISEVFSDIFGCSANAPPPHIGEDAENISQFIYHLYPNWIMRKDENEFNTVEYQMYYRDSVSAVIDALNSDGGNLENWDLDSGEAPYKRDENGQIISNPDYKGHVKCKEQGKLKDCGPVTRTGPGGDHPDDTVSVGSGINSLEASSLDVLYRFAPKKDLKSVLWFKNIQDANIEYSNLPLDAPAELRKEKLDRLSSLASQLNDPFNLREFSTNNSRIHEEIQETPDVAVLQNGYFEETTTLISRVHEPVKIVSLNFSLEMLNKHPVLIIPSGGLYGMDKSEFFKASLDEYVKRGGTLIVFSQQHGYEFSVLPVPQEEDRSYRTIGGYGWSEDQSCFVNAAYIYTWHQMLAGQSKSTPSLHFDGYFTTHPSNATVILRRTANGQPALLMYEYGQGKVIVTSMFSDFAHKQKQAFSEEMALIRDMISWAKRPDDLSEIRPGQTVMVSVKVKNITANDATSVRILIYNPNRSTLLSEQTVSVSIPAGRSAIIPVSYTTASISTLGIYHIDYTLLDAQGNIIQPQAETDSGRFVVSNPPATAYQPSKTYQLWVTSPAEHVFQGTDVTFTIHIKNNTSGPLQGAKLGIGSHEARSEGGRWWIYHEAIEGINIPAGGQIEIPWTFRIDISQSIFFGLFRGTDNPNTYLVREGLAWAEKGIRLIKPFSNITIQTDKTIYAKGETVIINASFKNNIALGWQPNVKIAVSDSKGTTVFEDLKTIALPASGTGSVSTSFTLLQTSAIGTYAVKVEAWYGTTLISKASTSFQLPQSQISVLPNLPSAFSMGTNTIPFTISNTGKINISVGTLELSLKAPDGSIVYAGSQPFSIAVGETKTLDIPISIPSLELGNYVLTYSQSDETRGGKPTSITIPNSMEITNFSFDKVFYRVRETANLNTTIKNTGKFNLENISVAVSVPDVNFTELRAILLEAGNSSSLDFTIPIPETVSAGHHNVSVALTLPGEVASVNRYTTIYIPTSSLSVRYQGPMTLPAGDMIEMIVENFGGVDTDYEAYIYFADQIYGFYDSKSTTGSIQVGDQSLLSYTLPDQLTNGGYTLGIVVEDKKTNKTVFQYASLTVTGLSGELSVRTDKDIYLSNEETITLSMIVNQGRAMVDGNLHLEIVCAETASSPPIVPVSFHIFTEENHNWVERGILHFPPYFERQEIILPISPDQWGNAYIRIQHEGAQHALIDYIALRDSNGNLYSPDFVGVPEWRDYTAEVQTEDGSPAEVTGESFYAYWNNLPSGVSYQLVMTAWEASSCGIVWQTDITINQGSGVTQTLNISAGSIGQPGKYYLRGDLTNRLGQSLGTSYYPFYIIDGDTALLFNTNKRIYRSGETVTITGRIENLASITAENLMVTLNTSQNGQNLQLLLIETINLLSGESYPFTITTTAGEEGIVNLVGAVKQNHKTLARITDQYEVALPNVFVNMTAPEAIGNESFSIEIELWNDANVEASVQIGIQSSEFGGNQTITLPAWGTKLIQYQEQIRQTTTYTVTLTGDLNETITKTVTYGLGASIQFGVEGSEIRVFAEGSVAIPVSVTNTGHLAETLAINFTLSPGDSTQTKTYSLQPEANTTDVLYFNLTEGDYQITATSQRPDATAQASFSVRKGNQVEMAVSLGSQADGRIPVNVNLTNIGFNEISGSVNISVTGGAGQTVWNGEETFSQLSPQGSQLITLNINPTAIEPGIYTLQAQLLNNSHQVMATRILDFGVKSANFQITQLPPYQIFNPGQEATFVFRVKNIGDQEGSFDLRFKAYDLIDSAQREWLKPGEEKAVTFGFMLPEDLEEKDYFASYILEDSPDSTALQAGKSGTVPQKGQVKYHLAGISLNVNATLDKPYYTEGETARLTINIQSPNFNPQSLFVRVNYAGYEPQQTFTLNGSQVLVFDVPLPRITGEKLFYGIYHEGGRSIHLNSLYIHKAGDIITVTTDKQVYRSGETVSVTVAGNTSGDMILSGPGGYTETFLFSGQVTRTFTLPSTMAAGTYFIHVQLTTPNSGLITENYPFDVAGIQVKVIECQNDRGKYAPADTISTSLTISSNTTMPALLKAWIVDPTGHYTIVGELSIGLSSIENSLTTFHSPLGTSVSGIHRLVYGIYGPENLLLCSGSEAFDVGDAVLLGLSTDKRNYLTNTEPVIVTASLFGSVQAELQLELDGSLIKTEMVSLSGITSYTTQLQNITPGPHTLKATLTAGELISTKETGFTYALAFMPKPQISVSPVYLDFGNIKLGSASTQTITISSTGNAELVIGMIALSRTNQGGFSIQNDTCSGRTIASSGNCTLDILFSPASLGAKSASLFIPSNATEMPTHYLPLSGTGITNLSISINPTGSGRVTGTGIDCPGDCTESFTTEGAAIQLTAAPTEGYQFTNWTGDIHNQENPVTLTMDTHKNVTANFTINAFTVTATATLGGAISPSGLVIVNPGGNQTFIITPIPGYYIMNVMVDGVSVGPVATYTFNNVTSNHTIEATFAVENSPPVADAGPDRNVITGQVVTLNGSESFDPEGAMITFLWTFVEIPSASRVTDAFLSDVASAKPTFTPDMNGVYRLRLIVNDGVWESIPDEVAIHAATPNVAPNANAGPDQNAYTGNTVQLDGSMSRDSDNGPLPLSYLWSFVTKPSESLLTDNSIAYRTMPHAGLIPDVDGLYELRLIVTDGDLFSEDTVQIIAVPPNVPPNANAGADSTIYLGGTITLDGSASNDPDQGPQPLSYLWSFIAVPTGSQLTHGHISGVNTVFPSFTPDVAGTYVLQLMVFDGRETGYDNVAVTVLVDHIAPTLAPVANLTTLWPPNHRMVDITIRANASDNSGRPVALTAVVTSNEPQDGLGDGDMSPDWTEPVIDQINGVITLKLRAERSGRGTGRIYTITIIATDASGNHSQARVEIKVPHDRGKMR
jgi:hypothetical protein